MDRRQIIKRYFTDKHYDNEKLRCLFIEPIIEEFGLLSDYIETLQMFGSIDEVPSKFVEDLGNSLAYEYLQEENLDIQREIIKRILSVYKNRASRESIERVLESSTDRNWIGDDLTLYKGDIVKGYKNIWLPRDRVFTHDKSIHDGGDAFADRFQYNYGVINLEMQFFDDRTLEMLEQQIPGGIRWNIGQLVWMSGSDGTGIPSFYTDYADISLVEDIIVKPEYLYVPSEIARFDQMYESYRDIPEMIVLDYGGNQKVFDSNQAVTRWNAGNISYRKKPVRSGRYIVSSSVEEDLIVGGSYLRDCSLILVAPGNLAGVRLNAGLLGSPNRGIKLVDVFNRQYLTSVNSFIERQVVGFDTNQQQKGKKYFDISFHDDGLARDGLDESDICVYARYREIRPNDFMYSVSDIIDLTVIENADSKTFGFEVEVI